HLKTYARRRPFLSLQLYKQLGNSFSPPSTPSISRVSLEGVSASPPKVHAQQETNWAFPDRTRLAHIFFGLGPADQTLQVCNLHNSIIKDLMTLCILREILGHERVECNQTDGKLKMSNVCFEGATAEPELFPLICLGTQCLFCM